MYKTLREKPEVVAEIEKILDNKPKPAESFGRRSASGELA